MDGMNVKMTMHNVYHEACVQNVHERIVKAKRRMETCIGVISLTIGEKLDLYYEHCLPPTSTKN